MDMDNNIKKRARYFFTEKFFDKRNSCYCINREIFQARLDRMIVCLLKTAYFKDDDVYILVAIAGEIGSNSFDHNIGSWFGEMGIFFDYKFDDQKLIVALSDKGQGVYETLKKVRPSIKDSAEALNVAFNEVVSGRAPESRGNGLKFVKLNIKNRGMRLEFISGKARAILNNEEIIENIDDNYQGCLAIISLKL